MPKTYCPYCDAVISVKKPREGAYIQCPECGVELEIISTDPFEVDFPQDWEDEEEVDWEDEEEVDWEDEEEVE